MRAITNLAMAMAGLCGLATPSAWAGQLGDDLGKCMVKASSPEDQTLLTQWMFSAITLHPAVTPYVNMTDAQREDIATKTGAMVERLLSVNCRNETAAALRGEGATSLQGAFAVLTQNASRGLISDPGVAASLANLGAHIDQRKVIGVLRGG